MIQLYILLYIQSFSFFVFFFITRLNIIGSSTQQVIFQKLSKIFLSQVIFLLVFTLTLLNYMLDLYQEMLLFSVLDTNLFGSYMTTVSFDKLVNLNSISLNLLDVYLYPFIYVFLLITVLSIVFCLSYNKDELISFMFYCKVILLAGYFLFFTDSLIIFFSRMRCCQFRLFLFYINLQKLEGAQRLLT